MSTTPTDTAALTNTSSSTIDRLKRIISHQLDIKVDQTEIDSDVSLLEDGLGLDSIAIVELVSLLEENFGLKFEEEDLSMEPFASVRTLANYIDSMAQDQGKAQGLGEGLSAPEARA